MITPKLIRENPPEIRPGNAERKAHVKFDWPKVLKRVAAAKSWYKIDHEFGTPSSASKVAARLQEIEFEGTTFEATRRGNFVWVRRMPELKAA